MWLIDLIGGIVEIWCSWRFFVCAGAALGIAIALHNAFPDQAWVWFVSVPTTVTGIVLGLWWQIRTDKA